jgi:hypothetical protein
VPIGDEEVAKAPFYRPPDNSPEITYLMERRKQLGGFVPKRIVQVEPLKTDTLPELFSEEVEERGNELPTRVESDGRSNAVEAMSGSNRIEKILILFGNIDAEIALPHMRVTNAAGGENRLVRPHKQALPARPGQ